jgi:outer membrane protein
MLRILFLYTAFFRLLIILCMFVSRTTLACSEDETCIEKSSWQLGFAFGVGVKTNPLVDGELGYQWLSQPTFAFETFIQLDRESAFFSFLHPANILISTENAASNSTNVSALPDLSVSPDENIQNNQRSLSIDDIVSRKWAINGGIRGHYFLSNGEWQLTLQQDISNIHQGQQVGLEYSHRWLWHDFRLGLRVGTDWKSADLIDYYYGVSQRDTSLSRFYFQGKSGWQTYMSINAQKPINENWSWLANIGYRRLPNSLLSSPLIDQNNIRNVFLGVAYRF